MLVTALLLLVVGPKQVTLPLYKLLLNLKIEVGQPRLSLKVSDTSK